MELIILIICIIIGFVIFDTIIDILKIVAGIFVVYWLYQFISPVLATVFTL